VISSMKQNHRYLLLLCALIATMMTVSFVSAEDEYKGAEYCGMCHAAEYEGWLETSHANAAGMTAEGTFWVADPDDPARNQGDLAAWKDGCAECHVLNWDAEAKTFAFSETEPEKGLNIQCENCHGAYVPHSADNPAMDLDYTHESCVECHSGRQVEDHLNSRHSQTYEDLQTSDHAGDGCLHCMTTQGAIGGAGSVAMDTEGLVSLSCVACHDMHSEENPNQLRAETADDLCAKCHVGSHHPQSEEAVYPSGPHDKADVECVECHGLGEHFAHGHVSAWFNHTFWIYDTYWPYNDTRPMTCSKCHDIDWATEQLEVIEHTTETMTHAAEEIIESAYAVIEAAGLSESEAAEYTLAVDTAADTVHYWMADASGGLHNPEGTFAAISAAAHDANEAAVEALEASNTELTSDVGALEAAEATLEAAKATLESEVTALESSVSDLEAEIEELSNQGIPGFPVSSIALGLLMSAAAVFYISKPKQII
jgi:predicted CXXCH cytochrome family protein